MAYVKKVSDWEVVYVWGLILKNWCCLQKVRPLIVSSLFKGEKIIL